MNQDEVPEEILTDEMKRSRRPFRKSSGPGRERKQKARRASRRKAGGTPPGGMHRRGQKQRSN